MSPMFKSCDGCGRPIFETAAKGTRDVIWLEVASNGGYETHSCSRDTVVREKSILEEAHKITREDRNKAYDEPVRNHEQIGRIASEILKKTITAKDVAIIQIATKLSRESFKHKRDNLVDLAGYAYVLSKIEGD